MAEKTIDTVVSIRQAGPAVNQALVEVLEDLLVDAKAGVLQTIAFVGERTGQEIVSGRTRLNSIPMINWAFDLLKFRIMLQCEDAAWTEDE